MNEVIFEFLSWAELQPPLVSFLASLIRGSCLPLRRIEHWTFPHKCKYWESQECSLFSSVSSEGKLPQSIYSGGKWVRLALKCSSHGPCVCSLSYWSLPLCQELDSSIDKLSVKKKKCFSPCSSGPIVSAVRIRASCCSAGPSVPFWSHPLLREQARIGWVGSGRVRPEQLHADVCQETPPLSLQMTGQKDLTDRWPTLSLVCFMAACAYVSKWSQRCFL